MTKAREHRLPQRAGPIRRRYFPLQQSLLQAHVRVGQLSLPHAAEATRRLPSHSSRLLQIPLPEVVLARVHAAIIIPSISQGAYSENRLHFWATTPSPSGGTAEIRKASLSRVFLLLPALLRRYWPTALHRHSSFHSKLMILPALCSSNINSSNNISKQASYCPGAHRLPPVKPSDTKCRTLRFPP